MVYGWRGHRQQLSRLTAHPDELLVATAGRGNVAGQELHVVRCWNLAYASAGISSCQAALCWLEHSIALLAGSVWGISTFGGPRDNLAVQPVFRQETVYVCNTASRRSWLAAAPVAKHLCFVVQDYCVFQELRMRHHVWLLLHPASHKLAVSMLIVSMWLQT